MRPGPDALPLVCHPAAPPAPGLTLTASATRPADGGLALVFCLTGALDGLRIPAARPGQRADRLWEHSCFEAFVGVTGSPAYHEFNLAPSGDWAAWAFAGYRDGMRALPAATAPTVTTTRAPAGFTLSAWLPSALLPAAAKTWQVGLATVLEDTAGGLSYWAMHHPAPKPDFHAAAAFTLTLAPPVPA